MAWQKNGTPDTLTTAGDTLQITDLTALTFNQFLVHIIDDGTDDLNQQYKTDNNSNTDYARRRSNNGGSDATTVNQAFVNFGATAGGLDRFQVSYWINISGEEKLMIGHGVESDTAGASNAPSRIEIVGKVDTTTNSGQFTRVDIDNTQTGSYATESNLSALSTD